MKKLQKIEKGDFVESNYRSRWKGIVLKSVPYKLNFPIQSTGYICTILIIKDGNGHLPRRRIVRNLNQDWLTKIEKIDISHINKDWF